MKLRLMPVVASLCGMFICASAAQANSVYVHNRPVENVVTINNSVYVPFNELMKGLKYSWSLDKQGQVVLKENGSGGPALNSANFTVAGEKGKFAVQGVMRDGQVWVPVRIAKDLGYELSYNPKTEIVDILRPRLKTDADRAAEAEVNQARAAREAQLAKEREEQRAALEERKQAMADLKAKREGKNSEAAAADSPAEPANEGAYDQNFEEIGERAAREVEARQKEVGGVDTYADLLKVQQQLDEQDIARRAAIRKAKQEAGLDGDGEKEAAVPAPNLIVFAPRATPDYFTGHINMTATVKNIGNAEAKTVNATVSLVSPDGTIINTQRFNRVAVPANGQWDISTGYDHIAGAEMPRGNYTLQVNVDHANKPADK